MYYDCPLTHYFLYLPEIASIRNLNNIKGEIFFLNDKFSKPKKKKKISNRAMKINI